MTTTAILFATMMIASGAVRIGLIMLAIWAIIRLVDRLRTPVAAQPAPTTPSVEQSASPAVEA
ncbi:MAG: hypothetical protein ACK5S9_10485 [Roseiflexaceae bacterium]|jgi:hypothetical protein|nr:MAG: hypothetical protein DWI55_03000 [Chloroflexota bacterium]